MGNNHKDVSPAIIDQRLFTGGAAGSQLRDTPFPFMVFNRNERLVLRELANGHSATDIAERLEMAVSTIGRHMRSAVRKAGLQNRYQLLVFIFQTPRGLLKGGRFAPGLHNQATCECPCCRNMAALDTAALDDVPSVRQVVDLARSPITGVSSPVAGLPNFPRG